MVSESLDKTIEKVEVRSGALPAPVGKVLRRKTEHCQEVMRIMEDGSSEEMNLHIQKIREGAEGEKKTSTSCGFVDKLIHSTEGGTKILRQVTKPTP